MRVQLVIKADVWPVQNLACFPQGHILWGLRVAGQAELCDN
jgi:hypothetical protein